MAGVFNANGDYKPGIDARAHGGLAKALGAPPQKGVLFPLIGARRAGKTWALRALERLLCEKHPGSARFIDLSRQNGAWPSAEGARCLLVDEPQLTAPGDAPDAPGLRSPIDLLRWCEALHGQGITILLAMSPAEWAELRKAGEPLNLVSARDLRYLQPITDKQAERIARTGWAKRLLPSIPEAWRRRPFLLELLFQFVEEEEVEIGPGDDLGKLVDTVSEWSEGERFGYFRTVFWNGLGAAQRGAIRQAANRVQVEGRDVEILEQCGLLERAPHGYVIGDPILAANLQPFRIHHLSDIHFGAKSAMRVDVKEKGPHAEAMAKGLGAERVADHYVDHVRELAAAGRAPHLLIISGDVAEWATDEEYAAARAWLSALQALLAPHPRLPADANHVLITGGNHDVDWKATGGPAGGRERHRAFARAFEGLPRTRRTRLEEPPETRALVVERYTDLGMEVVLLGSAEFGGEEEKDPARAEMIAFLDGLRRRVLTEAEEDAAKAAELRAKVVSRIDPGLVHQEDLKRLRQHRSSHDVKIAVLHHPVSPLPFTELARFAGLVNAGEVKDALMEREVCLVLHGHAHMGWFGQEHWPEREAPRDWVLRIAAAPSLGSREINEQNGYNEIAVAREPGEKDRSPYTITVRRVVRKGASWEPGKTMGPFAPGV